jgi:hypothetical protein
MVGESRGKGEGGCGVQGVSGRRREWRVVLRYRFCLVKVDLPINFKVASEGVFAGAAGSEG